MSEVKVDLIRARGYAESLRDRAHREAKSEGDHMALTTYAAHLDAMADEIDRMRAEFARHSGAALALYDDIYRIAFGSIGGKIPHGCTPLRAVELLADRAGCLQANLEAVVSHWNEFGGEAGFDVPMDRAWRYLNGLPPVPPAQITPEYP